MDLEAIVANASRRPFLRATMSIGVAAEFEHPVGTHGRPTDHSCHRLAPKRPPRDEATAQAEREALVDLSVETVNAVLAGLEDSSVLTCVHLCHSHGEGYEASEAAASLLHRAVGLYQAGRLAMEFSSPAAAAMQRLDDPHVIIALGVVDTTTIAVEPADAIVARVERAMRHLPASRISINPDCGFATSAKGDGSLDAAFEKLSSMATAARTLRAKFAASML